MKIKFSKNKNGVITQIKEYNDSGQLKHVKDFQNLSIHEQFYEYNDFGQVTHFIELDEYDYVLLEKSYEYNDSGKLIHYADSEGIQKWYIYMIKIII